MKALTHIPKVSAEQIAFGDRVGLDLRGCTVGVATARVRDAIAKGFYGNRDLGSPTSGQIELAAKFGYDIAGLSYGEGHAVINDLMIQLNLETIESQELAPGVTVIHIHDKSETRYVISSIQENGTVYFKGGRGHKAWARNLRRVVDA